MVAASPTTTSTPARRPHHQRPGAASLSAALPAEKRCRRGAPAAPRPVRRRQRRDRSRPLRRHRATLPRAAPPPGQWGTPTAPRPGLPAPAPPLSRLCPAAAGRRRQVRSTPSRRPRGRRGWGRSSEPSGPPPGSPTRAPCFGLRVARGAAIVCAAASRLRPQPALCLSPRPHPSPCRSVASPLPLAGLSGSGQPGA
ncbi:uncharacterized protein LOC135192962 [Pogoniulus pusillus]|uniref:uncharacterized protein LOC135192962 n=1 Tax=Pogoniulus pusillus TaxID=488313 RepID=UPI0030B96634